MKLTYRGIKYNPCNAFVAAAHKEHGTYRGKNVDVLIADRSTTHLH